MKEIIKKDAPQYIIFRKNNNGKEYYDGANLYGKDSDGVLRIAKAKWSKEFHSAYATYDFDKMNEILNGSDSAIRCNTKQNRYKAQHKTG